MTQRSRARLLMEGRTRPITEPTYLLLSEKQLLRSEIPSGMCAKLRTVAASNNRDHSRNLSSCTLVIMFNCSHVNIYRATTSQYLLLLLARSTHTYFCSSRTSCSW